MAVFLGGRVVLNLREAYVSRLILLLCLELFYKFVVGGAWVGGWLRPILVFSLSLDQAKRLQENYLPEPNKSNVLNLL